MALFILLFRQTYPALQNKIDSAIKLSGKTSVIGLGLLMAALLAAATSAVAYRLSFLAFYPFPQTLTVEHVDTYLKNWNGKVALEYLAQGYLALQLFVIVASEWARRKGMVRWFDLIVPTVLFTLGIININLYKLSLSELTSSTAKTVDVPFNYLLIAMLSAWGLPWYLFLIRIRESKVFSMPMKPKIISTQKGRKP